MSENLYVSCLQLGGWLDLSYSAPVQAKNDTWQTETINNNRAEDFSIWTEFIIKKFAKTKSWFVSYCNLGHNSIFLIEAPPADFQ